MYQRSTCGVIYLANLIISLWFSFLLLGHLLIQCEYKCFLQFGMLIQHLFETFPNWEDIGEQAIGDLQVICNICDPIICT